MFSIVIPLYNKENSILNTIMSILNQSCSDFEVLIINDGSTDKSISIVEEIKDDRIRIISQENQGVSSARNRGINEAKYEWICFLDADDLWKEFHLTTLLEMMRFYSNYKVYTTSFEYSIDKFIFRHKRNKEIFVIENYFEEATKELLICVGSVVIHRDCFKEVGNFNKLLSRGEDKDLWIRLARKYPIVKSQKITMTYRLDAENRSDSRENVKKTYEANVRLKEIKDKRDYKLHKVMIMNKIKKSIILRDWRSFFYLLFKHNVRLLMTVMMLIILKY